jgi:alpha-L-fucosidase 2
MQGPILSGLCWYEKPATQWSKRCRFGNGRLEHGFGGTATERLQLNEDTLYAGGPYDPNNREALRLCPKLGG